MHPNQIFRHTPRSNALEFAKQAGFGVLTLNGEETPLLAHVPFYICGNDVYLHLVRSNPMARDVKESARASLVVSGPHGYILPDWYGVKDQVPTWNYVAVHLSGVLSPLPSEQLRDVLDRLSDQFETQLAPKPVWKSDKMDPSALAKMMRVIQPFKLAIDDVQSTFKLGQNKSDDARLGAAGELAKSAVGSETALLAKMMSDLAKKDHE